MAKKYSAFVSFRNDTDYDISDLQVVLNNDAAYLFQFGRVAAKTTSASRFGMISVTGITDYWTVTYKNNSGKVQWIVDQELSVKDVDAGQNVQIVLQSFIFGAGLIRITAPISGNTGAWTVTVPG